MSQKPNKFVYRFVQFLCFIVAKVIFRRRYLRNEIKGKKGPFVVIANHACALDFVNLIGATKTPMTFVISNTFYTTLPFKAFMDRIGVIPKQQFQTFLSDLYKMKAAVKNDGILVIYPAGLMCEDGQSTPIPVATYDFLRWMKADVYMARTIGTYFAMPKWAKGMRAGRTYIDIYKLFDREELAALDDEALKTRTNEALLFDSYEEQEEHLVKYAGGDRVEGLENVLYQCPHCGTEYAVRPKDKRTLACAVCGYEQESDKYGFFHNKKGIGREIRHVSAWSRRIYEDLKARVKTGEAGEMSLPARIRRIDTEQRKFLDIGEGVVTVGGGCLRIDGIPVGEENSVSVPLTNFASLPFSPGKYFEIQQGEGTYRCYPSDGRTVMKFVNLVKIHYELNTASRQRPKRTARA